MKNFMRIVLVSIMLVPIVAFSQQVFNFEQFTIPQIGYWNGSDGSGGFGNEAVNFVNNYNPDYSSWDGFSYSNLTNQTIASYENQFSTYAGEAYSGSNFGVIYPAYGGGLQSGYYTTGDAECIFENPVNVSEIWVTNSTYAALIILDGDFFSEAFSTENNDFFKLIIEGKNGENTTGEVEFMLADYTGSEGIVIDDWQQVDLTSLGVVDRLVFSLASTKYNDYGITNPTYFCLDDLAFETTVFVCENVENSIKIYPNPTADFVNINGVGESQVFLTDISGKIIYQNNSCSENEIIDLTTFNSGVYILNVKSENYSISKKIIKK